MKVSGRIVLTGILSVTVGSLACYSAMAKDLKAAEQPAPEQALWPAAITDEIAKENGGVESWGNIEFGGRYFIQRPKDGSTPWLTPSIQRPDKQSIAKFEEYGAVPEGVYLERLNIGGQTKDAQYFVDLRATDVGNNNQRYVFDWAKTGEISGTISWDQILHLYSTTAQSIWHGVGTAHLTTDLAPLLGSQLYNGGIALTPAQQAAIIGPALSASLRTVKIGIDRDKIETDNRWTPTPNWEFRGGYSNERREGTQLSGIVWGGPGGPMRIDAPRPIGDTTQQGRASGERTGDWAYGKYNVKLTGTISTFDNDYSSFVVQNPFATIQTLNTSDYCKSTFNAPGLTSNAAPCAGVSSMPSNQAYTANMTTGIDLPFNSRFMNTVQYQTMRQDDQFMPQTVSLVAYDGTGANNGGITCAGCVTVPTTVKTALLPMPASSLNGEVNVLLVNNALTTQISPDWKSTLRYRYYDNDNQTPRRDWTWVQEDYTVSTNPRRNFGYSYSKQNASEDVTWHFFKNASIGGQGAWEQIYRDKREVLTTDEYSAKVYSDVRVDDFGMFRASYQYSERRGADPYDVARWLKTLYPLIDGTTYWNALLNGSPVGGALANNWGMRKFDLADRDRDKVFALFSFDNIPFVPNLTLTPNAGFRNDRYLTDPNKQVPTTGVGNYTYEVGLLKDDTWNAGIEAAYSFKPGTSIVLAYVRENFDKDLVGTPTAVNSVTGGQPNAPAVQAPPSRFFSNMREDVDTVIVGANIALNDNTDFSASYSIAFGKENWSAKAYGATSDCTVVGLPNCQPVPAVDTNAQRVDAVVKYKFNSEFVNKAGFSGDVFWNLKYSWDHLRINNWQNDLNTPYMYLVDASNNGRNISMSGINPNYDVHVVASSINLKW
jgi:hypothetical protein